MEKIKTLLSVIFSLSDCDEFGEEIFSNPPEMWNETERNLCDMLTRKQIILEAGIEEILGFQPELPSELKDPLKIFRKIKQT